MIFNIGGKAKTMNADFEGTGHFVEEKNGNWIYEITEANNSLYIPTSDMIVDIFLCGGGGGGGGLDKERFGNITNGFTLGGGGGGGYFFNEYGFKLEAGKEYRFNVGNGGVGAHNTTGTVNFVEQYIFTFATPGGKTYISSNGSVLLTANGGSRGENAGVKSQSYTSPGNGGSGGFNGGQGYYTSNNDLAGFGNRGGYSGSISTNNKSSVPFGDYSLPNSKRFCSGGCGGNKSSSQYSHNYGGGIGGSYGSSPSHPDGRDASFYGCGGGGGGFVPKNYEGTANGGNGYQGIIILRNARR